jgi:hypothetical protein
MMGLLRAISKLIEFSPEWLDWKAPPSVEDGAF